MDRFWTLITDNMTVSLVLLPIALRLLVWGVPPLVRTLRATDAEEWGRRLDRAMRARVMFSSLAVALLAGVVVNSFWVAGAVPALIGVGVLVYGFQVLDDDLVLACPYCRKRVKAGASVCHHCTRAVR